MGTKRQNISRQNYSKILERERAKIKLKEDLRLD
jgi:hypothetical protein